MPLSVLSRSRGKNSSPFIETNGRGTNSGFARNFTNLHLRKKPLDLKLTLRINIFLADMQLPWKKGENMETLSFQQLPLVVKIAIWVVFNNAWWSIEEFVIDRKGLWRYMPYYRVGNGCVWDLAVALIVGFAIWRASHRSSTRPA